MKLYVWVDPYNIPYGSTMVFAVANSEEEARQQAMFKGQAYSYGQYEQDRPNVVLGAPTRVVDLPCAEWHRWEE